MICVSEGAGQLLFTDQEESAPEEHAETEGDRKLHDIGAYLKKLIKARLQDVDVKYIDPTHLIEVGGGAARGSQRRGPHFTPS